ncbi:MAG: penicillin-binding protein activator LpoB [Bacteroidales bacterium]|nr:penicillin-binding protein activator LpoB [Bacteroidales bacterium]
MKKVCITSVIALLLSFTAMAQEEKKVAVFDPAGNVDNYIKEIVREEISSFIVNSVGYTVLERQLINEVLKEDKFRLSGLVDDSQITEIGKRIGADYVFVSNITPRGKNYYIACKMINVTTARIEKQKNEQTLKGSKDMISVIRRIVREMFINTPKTSQTNIQTIENNPVNPTNKLDIAGKKFFMDGKELNKREVRKLMVSIKTPIPHKYKGVSINRDVLSIYNKGVKNRRQGTALAIGGACLAAGGAIAVLEGHRNAPIIIGVPLLSVGAAGIGTGLVLRSSGKKDIRKAVDAYNSKNAFSNTELRFGTTGNGIGLVLNF